MQTQKKTIEIRAYDYDINENLTWDMTTSDAKGCLKQVSNPTIGGKEDSWNNQKGRYESYRNIIIEANNTQTSCAAAITLNVSDKNGNKDSKTFNITVKNTPYITSISNTKGAALYNFNAEILTSDKRSSYFTYTLKDPPQALNSFKLDGNVISGMPKIAGEFDLNIHIDGNSNGYGIGEYTGKINILNKPPKIVSPSEVEINAGENFEFEIKANDQEPYPELQNNKFPQMPITFTYGNKPDWINISDTINTADSATAKITRKTSSDTKDYVFTITATDKAGAYAAQTFTIKIKNRAPEITEFFITPIIKKVGESFSANVKATDEDGDALTYSLSGVPSKVIINNNGNIITQGNFNASDTGNYANAKVTVSDPYGGKAERGFVLNIKNLCNNSIVDEGEECDFGADASCCAGCHWTCKEGNYQNTNLTLANGEITGSGNFTLRIPPCRIMEAGGLKVDADIVGQSATTDFSGADIVFIVQYSGDADFIFKIFNQLKNSAVASKINIGVTNIEHNGSFIKLRSIADDMLADELSNFISKVYRDSSNSATDGIKNLNSFNYNTSHSKIGIMYNNGQFSATGAAYEDNTVVAINNAINAGFLLYVIPSSPVLCFPDGGNWATERNGHCISSGNLSGDIANDILKGFIPYELSITTIDSKKITIENDKQNISITGGISCKNTPQDLSFKAEFANNEGTVKFSNARLNYCPVLSAGTCELSADCGNNQIDIGEDCEGSNLNGKNCSSLGFTGGTLSCYAHGTSKECKYDTSLCVTCGNGILEDGEQCDGPVNCSSVKGSDYSGTVMCGVASRCGWGNILDQCVYSPPAPAPEPEPDPEPTPPECISNTWGYTSSCMVTPGSMADCHSYCAGKCHGVGEYGYLDALINCYEWDNNCSGGSWSNQRDSCPLVGRVGQTSYSCDCKCDLCP
ncbi:MAG: putative Ig domain-containing protein [bacterium]